MGNSSVKSKNTIEYQINGNQFQYYLQEVCNDVPNKKINKNNYDTILEKLHSFEIIALSSTPLGDRLYDFLTFKNQGTIRSDDLYNTLLDLYLNQDKRCECTIYNKIDTFRAFCTSGQNMNNLVLERDFVQIIMESWERAFSLLVEKFPQYQRQTDGNLIENWSKSDQQKKQVINAAKITYKNILKNRVDGIDFLSFKQWIIQASEDRIQAKYENYIITVPLTLYKFIK